MEKNMYNQVTYLMSGPAHLPYLVCSLHTLRKHWYGHVEVYCWPESYDIAKVIEEDIHLGVYVIKREPKLRKKDGVGGNAQFLDKIDLTTELKCALSLYLDADTTVHGSLARLFDVAAGRGFGATQWNDWVTNSGMVVGRLRELNRIEDIPKEHVATATTCRWPSVNGGVWVSVPSSPVLPTWYNWTKSCGPLFIADERVLHLMPAAFPDEVAIMTANGRYNTSPKHQSKELKDEDVVIYHYHGDSNVRPEKSQKGHDLWWPIYQECLALNVGFIQDWIDKVDNKWIKELESDTTNGPTA